MCSHGILKRDKYRTEQHGDLEICKGCGLPTPDSYRKALLSRGPVTPVRRAREARQRGQAFADSGDRTEHDNGQTLADIEAEGWRLHRAGYVFVPTGQSSRQKMLGSGESVAISGVTVGIYLFRSSDVSNL